MATTSFASNDTGVALTTAPQGLTSSAGLQLFLLTIMIPIGFELAGIRLSPNRIFVLVTCVPFMLQVLTGKIGRLTATDVFVLLFGCWIFVATIKVHGGGRISYAGMTFAELIGGYLVGRVLIRNIQDYKLVFRFMMVAMCILIPLAIVESLTGRLVIPELLDSIPGLDVPHRGRSAYPRWGLDRAYVVFAHPILYGLFCALSLANFVLIFRGKAALQLLSIFFTLFAVFFSLSSGPLLACAIQIIMLTWGKVMGGKWKLFLILTAIAYVGIDTLSDRTPITIIIETLTFNSGSGWTRIAIFEYGWRAARNSPIFGIGFNDWPRPNWVTASVDNFWLLMAMKFGFVGAGLLATSFVVHLYLLGRAKINDADVAMARVCHAVALVGVSFTLATVYIWGTIAVLVMFYLGSGCWMYAYDQSGTGGETGGDETQKPGKRLRYTRFEGGPHQTRAKEGRTRVRSSRARSAPV